MVVDTMARVLSATQRGIGKIDMNSERQAKGRAVSGEVSTYCSCRCGCALGNRARPWGVDGRVQI